jgi:hypothetical protein
MQHISHALDELFDTIEHPVDRAVFILFFVWGLTPHEIAYVFNTDTEEVELQINSMKALIESQYV